MTNNEFKAQAIRTIDAFLPSPDCAVLDVATMKNGLKRALFYCFTDDTYYTVDQCAPGSLDEQECGSTAFGCAQDHEWSPLTDKLLII